MGGGDYWRIALHPVLLQKTLDGAIAAGVRHVVLIGTVYPYGRPRRNPVREDHPREPHTFKGRMRREQEDLLMAAHAAGRILATVIRLPDFYGVGAGDKSFLSGAFQAAVDGGTAKLIGPIRKTPYPEGVRQTLDALRRERSMKGRVNAPASRPSSRARP